MALLVVGQVLFLGVHSLSISNKPARERLFAHLGLGPFKGLYSPCSRGTLMAVPGQTLCTKANIRWSLI